MARKNYNKKSIKLSKLVVLCVLISAMVMGILPQNVTAATGDVLGNVLYSNIIAYINDYAIPTSVINGKTLVTVEDLANYGFNVTWNGAARTLKVERAENKKFTPLRVEANTKPAGTVKEKYYETDIKTYLSGNQVTSYAVSGRTLIDFELLKKYGELKWIESTKQLRLTLRKVGDPLGDVVYSDIRAFINGCEIPTSITNGMTMVVVEDLADYGFDVVWNGAAKTLSVELNPAKAFSPLTVASNTQPVGAFKEKYVYTDIKTYLSGSEVKSYAVSGRTLIDFELLEKYGELKWEQSTKQLSLIIPNNAYDLINSGNTAGNITNSGLAAYKDDWIYYVSNDHYKLYKIRADGSGRTKLSDDGIECINVVGDWVYYKNGSDDFKLYKIRADGSDRTKLNDDYSYNISVVSGWVYYQNGSDGYKLYKIRTDGGGRTKLNDDHSGYINVVDGWVYYCNLSDDWKLYKIRADGSGMTKLNDDGSWYINVVGDWVYYSNDSDGGKLYKIGTNGRGKTKLNDDRSGFINVAASGDWVYYGNYNDDGKLYKMRTDGSGKTKLNDDRSWCNNIVGDWVYYCNADDSYKQYKIRTDGTERQLAD